jgi:hypothetical protein
MFWMAYILSFRAFYFGNPGTQGCTLLALGYIISPHRGLYGIAWRAKFHRSISYRRVRRFEAEAA